MPLLTSQHCLWQVRHAPFFRWPEAGQRYEAPNALRSPWVKPDLPLPGTEDPTPCFYIRCWKLPAAPAIGRYSGRQVSAALKTRTQELWPSSFAIYRIMFGSRDTVPWCLPFRISLLWRKSLFFLFSLQRSFIPRLFFKHCLACLFQWLSIPTAHRPGVEAPLSPTLSLPVLSQCLLLLFTLHCLSQHPPVVQGSLCTHFLFLWNSSNTRSMDSEKIK